MGTEKHILPAIEIAIVLILLLLQSTSTSTSTTGRRPSTLCIVDSYCGNRQGPFLRGGERGNGLLQRQCLFFKIFILALARCILSSNACGLTNSARGTLCCCCSFLEVMYGSRPRSGSRRSLHTLMTIPPAPYLLRAGASDIFHIYILFCYIYFFISFVLFVSASHWLKECESNESEREREVLRAEGGGRFNQSEVRRFDSCSCQQGGPFSRSSLVGVFATLSNVWLRSLDFAVVCYWCGHAHRLRLACELEKERDGSHPRQDLEGRSDFRFETRILCAVLSPSRALHSPSYCASPTRVGLHRHTDTEIHAKTAMQKLDKLRPPPIDPTGGGGQILQLQAQQLFHDPQQNILVATPLDDQQQQQTSFIAQPPPGSPPLFVAVGSDWSTGNTVWATTNPQPHPVEAAEPTSALLRQQQEQEDHQGNPLPQSSFTTTNTTHHGAGAGVAPKPAGVFYAPHTIQVHNPYTIIRRDSSMFLTSPTSNSGTTGSAFNIATGSPFTVHTAYVGPNGIIGAAPAPQPGITTAPVPLSPGTPGMPPGPHHGASHSTSSASSKFRDPAVAQRIVASVGLPLSTQSLSDFIREGQPPALPSGYSGHVKGRRNFPNCDSPPPLAGAAVSGGSPSSTVPPPLQQTGLLFTAPPSSAGGSPGTGANPPCPPPAYVVVDSSSTTNTNGAAPTTGWSVESNDLGGSAGPTSPFDLPNLRGAVHQSSGAIPASSAFDKPATPSGAISSTTSSHIKPRPKSENEVLTDLLHFHANFFPPPPPPRLPPQERRRRVELWYHYASKWDVTRRLPPPPRTPLPEMELEYKFNLSPLTRVPYHGNDWLEMCMRWFDVGCHGLSPVPPQTIPLVGTVETVEQGGANLSLIELSIDFFSFLFLFCPPWLGPPICPAGVGVLSLLFFFFFCFNVPGSLLGSAAPPHTHTVVTSGWAKATPYDTTRIAPKCRRRNAIATTTDINNNNNNNNNNTAAHVMIRQRQPTVPRSIVMPIVVLKTLRYTNGNEGKQQPQKNKQTNRREKINNNKKTIIKNILDEQPPCSSHPQLFVVPSGRAHTLPLSFITLARTLNKSISSWYQRLKKNGKRTTTTKKETNNHNNSNNSNNNNTAADEYTRITKFGYRGYILKTLSHTRTGNNNAKSNPAPPTPTGPKCSLIEFDCVPMGGVEGERHPTHVTSPQGACVQHPSLLDPFPPTQTERPTPALVDPVPPHLLASSRDALVMNLHNNKERIMFAYKQQQPDLAVHLFGSQEPHRILAPSRHSPSPPPIRFFFLFSFVSTFPSCRGIQKNAKTQPTSTALPYRLSLFTNTDLYIDIYTVRRNNNIETKGSKNSNLFHPPLAVSVWLAINPTPLETWLATDGGAAPSDDAIVAWVQESALLDAGAAAVVAQLDALLDAFHSPDPPATTTGAPGSREVTVLRALAVVLHELVATQSCAEKAGPPRRRKTEAGAVADAGLTLRSAPVRDALLLLALFWSDFATCTDPQLLAPISSATGAYFALVIPLLYQLDPKEAGTGTGEGEGAAVLLNEVRSLRVMAARRLERFSRREQPHHTHLFYATLCGTLRLYATATLLAVTAAGSSAETGTAAADAAADTSGAGSLQQALQADLVQLVAELLAPLAAEVAAVAAGRRSHAAGPAASQLLLGPVAAAAPPSAPPASALLLSALLHEVTGLLGACRDALQGLPAGWLEHIAAEDAASATAASHHGSGVAPAAARALIEMVCRLVQRVVVDLVHTLQAHAQARQRRQADLVRQHAGGSTDDLQDPLSAFSVQRGLQTLLSLALDAFPPAVLRSAPLRAAAQAALTSSLGGRVALPAPLTRCLKGDEGPVAAALVLADGVRPCCALLEARHHVAGGLEDGGADDAGLEDGEEAALGRGPLLATAFGSCTAAELAEMLLQEAEVAALHRSGREAMQRRAALAAQREEVERRRRMEREDVEAIPAPHLLERASTSVLQTGKTLLRRPETRAGLQKAAFLSVLRSYRPTRRQESAVSYREGEALTRTKQALIARCLVQLPRVHLDAAMDELLLHFQIELTEAAKARQALLLEQQQQLAAAEANGRGPQRPPPASVSRAPINYIRDAVDSYYSLVVQVLFMFYAALAPTRAQRHVSLLRLEEDGDGQVHSVDGQRLPTLPSDPLIHMAEEEEAEAGAGGHLLQSTGRGTLAALDTERPASFLKEDPEADPEASAQRSAARKRGRAAAEAAAPSFFADDAQRRPSAYSHFLCRVVEVIRPLDRLLLLHFLMEAPCLTRYAWHYLYNSLCLSTEEQRCKVGIALLTDLAVLREAYRRHAIQLLLDLCVSHNAFARRLSIEKVGKLLAADDPKPSHHIPGDGPRPLIGEDTVELLVRHAKLKVAAIPAFQVSDRTVDRLVAAAESGDTAAQQPSKEELAVYKRERERLTDQTQTHLGLFPLLCLRQPRELMPCILDVYQQCVEKDNLLMARLLLQNKDIPLMLQHLLQYDPHTTATVIFPLLRRHSRRATLLVQSLLLAIMSQLRALAEADKNPTEESQAELRGLATTFIATAQAMWRESVIPLQSEGKPVLHDFRFLTSTVAFLNVKELQEKYLPQLLYFVQTQLELQQYHVADLTAREREFVLTRSELREFISDVLRVLILKHPLQPEGASQHRMSRVHLLTYLHNAPAETQKAYRRQAEKERAGDPGEGGEEAGTVGPDEVYAPPILAITTKEVINECFHLTVSVPDPANSGATLSVPVFGLEEVRKTVRRLMRPQQGVGSVPPQLLATLLHAAHLQETATHGAPRNDYVQLTVSEVLEPLTRMSTWEHNPQLWAGALHFMERFYRERECRALLEQLPDNVLLRALREHPSLKERFAQEHKHDAAFARLLQSL
eukprot:gene1664-1030_t